MGWDPEKTTKADVMAYGGKRHRHEHWEQMVNSPLVYKRCGVCGLHICVNNWEDKKARTPRLGGLVICAECDPRYNEDRYLKKGYRLIHPRRLRILKMAQIVHKLQELECMKGSDCGKCPTCVARKVLEDD